MKEQLTNQEKSRYSRHLLLDEIGEQGQKKLKNARVLVVGAGGLGCPVLQYLTAAGVGHIGVIDMDAVEESNLQRQILYTVDDIGINKAVSAKKHLQKLNPLIGITAYPTKLTTRNAIELFEQYDIVIDGSDNFATRYLVNDACLLTQKPLVYGSIYKFEGQVAVFNYEGSATYRCLFPTPPEVGSVPSCSEIGVLGVLPGIVGSMQANECLKLILGIGQPLVNQFLVYNALDYTTLLMDIAYQAISAESIPQTKTDFKKMDYPHFCGIKEAPSLMKEITVTELLEHRSTYTLVDVREIYEQPRPQSLAGINIPLPRLLACVDQIPMDKPVVVICQKGIRSRIAIETLEKKFGYDNLINLKGGIVNWMKLDVS